jgi:hypothetical protein
MSEETARQFFEVLAPGVDAITVLPLTASVLVVDLTSLAQLTALGSGSNATVKGSEHTNPIGQFCYLIGDLAFSFAFGPTAASVASIANTNASTVPQGAGATQYQVPGGKTTNPAILWPASTPLRVRLHPGSTTIAASGAPCAWGSQSPHRYLGALAASATNLRLWVASR